MKKGKFIISKGSSLEFLIALLFLFFGGWLFKIFGVIIAIHFIYLIIQNRKLNKIEETGMDDEQLIEKKKTLRLGMIVFIVTVCIIIQIFLIFYLLDRDNDSKEGGHHYCVLDDGRVVLCDE